METTGEGIHRETKRPKAEPRPDFRRERDRIIEKYGPWTTVNWKLGDGVYTMGPGVQMTQEDHVRCLTQLISDMGRKPLSEMRILDLASLEGIYSIELALQGAKVLGIEGREGNVEKSRLVKKRLKLSQLEFVQDDVRNLNREKYGSFDAVICAGILYHLDTPDVFSFLQSIYDVCEGFAIIDTHFAFTEELQVTHKGKKYSGIKFPEHVANSTSEERERLVWASLDNNHSFWLTKASLINALTDVGFTSVLECEWPARLKDYSDRVFLVAFKGKPTESKIFGKGAEPTRYPQQLKRPYSPFQEPPKNVRAQLTDAASTLVRKGKKVPGYFLPNFKRFK